MSSYYQIKDYDFIKGDLLKRVEEHNATVADWLKDKANLKASYDSLLNEDPLCVDSACVTATRDKVTAEQLSLFQREKAIAENTIALTNEVIPVGHKAEDAAREHRRKVLESVLKRLAKAGITLESQQAWPHNHEMARQQLEHEAAKSSDCVEASQKREAIDVAVKQLMNQRVKLRDAVESIRNDAKQLIERTVKSGLGGLALV